MSRRAERLALAGICALGLVVVAGVGALSLLHMNAPRGFEPVSWLARPAIDEFARTHAYPRFSLDAGTLGRMAAALVLLVCGAYAAAAWSASRLVSAGAVRAALAVAAAVTVLAHAVLLVLPPVLSNDVFLYAIFGRMVAFHDLNPYVTPPSALVGDPLLPLVQWPALSSHWGPAFTWLSAGAAWIGGDDALATALAFRTMTSAFNLAGAVALWRLARLGGDSGVVPVLLYSWNPLALIEAAGSGHNEAIMIALALLGVWLGARGRVGSGLVALLLSSSVKQVAGALALYFVVYHLARTPGGRPRWRLAARLAALGALVTAALHGPFWAEASGVTAHLDLVLRGRDLVGAAGSAGRSPALSWLAILALGVLVAASAAACARGGPARMLVLAAVAHLFFVAFVFDWKFPWYFLPPAAWAVAAGAVAPQSASVRAFRLAAVWTTAIAMLGYGALAPA